MSALERTKALTILSMSFYRREICVQNAKPTIHGQLAEHGPHSSPQSLDSQSSAPSPGPNTTRLFPVAGKPSRISQTRGQVLSELYQRKGELRGRQVSIFPTANFMSKAIKDASRPGNKDNGACLKLDEDKTGWECNLHANLHIRRVIINLCY